MGFCVEDATTQAVAVHIGYACLTKCYKSTLNAAKSAAAWAGGIITAGGVMYAVLLTV